MQQRLREFSDHPLVGEVRGKGLIAAIELVADKSTRRGFPDGRVGAMAKQYCQDHGLLIRAVSGNCLAFCPPLIITTGQVDEMIDMFSKALDDTNSFVSKENLLAG
jgi:adenosylmethionine-8-amino-7-oxononanoate aminotransferase